jgi:hypothetical protein
MLAAVVLTMALFLVALARETLRALWRKEPIQHMREYWTTWFFIMVLSIPPLAIAFVL